MANPTDNSKPANTPAPQGSAGDPVADRRVKLARIRNEMQLDPFGRRVDGLLSLSAARDQYDKAADEHVKSLAVADPATDNRPIVKVAGRIILHRDGGKLIFMTLRD